MWSYKFETSAAKLFATVICGAGLMSVPAVAQTQLINNGGFESGTLAGWTVFDLAPGSGSFYLSSGTGNPGGNGCCSTVGPKTGTFYASSGQNGPGTHALLQTFTVSPAAVGSRRIILEFDQFVNDYDGGAINPAGLDHTVGPNEHARVDLLTATSTPLNTTTGVIRNFYIGNDGIPVPVGSPLPYKHYVFDISNDVGAGGTFQLRFAESDNQGFFNQGVDNVSIVVTDLNVFQVRYASNLTAGDSVINLTNTGANGASLNGPGFGGAAGNICVNVYAFSPDEQLVSCCSCLITPNGLASLSVNSDLISNTLTGVRPNSVVVKLVNTGAGAGFTGTTCTNSAATAGTAAFPLAAGMLGFGTTIHAAPVTGTFGVTETPFLNATLSTQELASITNRCANIIGNGSTFGICRSCRVGGLASDR